jgi:hypothetical protein
VVEEVELVEAVGIDVSPLAAERGEVGGEEGGAGGEAGRGGDQKQKKMPFQSLRRSVAERRSAEVGRKSVRRYRSESSRVPALQEARRRAMAVAWADASAAMGGRRRGGERCKGNPSE